MPIFLFRAQMVVTLRPDRAGPVLVALGRLDNAVEDCSRQFRRAARGNVVLPTGDPDGVDSMSPCERNDEAACTGGNMVSPEIRKYSASNVSKVRRRLADLESELPHLHVILYSSDVPVVDGEKALGGFRGSLLYEDKAKIPVSKLPWVQEWIIIVH